MDLNLDLIKRINKSYEDDIIRSAIAATADELPLSYESITDEWLSNVLCRSCPEIKVVRHALGSVDNGTSNRRKIYLEYSADGEVFGLPSVAFCKASHAISNRIALGVSGAARSEVLFYNEIRPDLKIEAPQPLYANMDAESFNSMIILKDLSGDVHEFCTQGTSISRQLAESQLELLAELHGSVLASSSLSQRIRQLPTFPEFFANMLGFGLREGAEAGFIAAQSSIPERLYARHREVWQATVASLADHDSMPRTLIHGDVHLKNWYITKDARMGLADWQGCARGHWSRDVAYAMSTALHPDDRRAWERDLLGIYLDRLHAAGGPKVDFDEGMLSYRRQLLSSLAWWTLTLAPPAGLPDMQPQDDTLEFIKRIAIAVDDLDVLDLFI